MVEPKGDGVTLLYVASILMALSWLTVLTRLSVRRWLKPEAMGLDDYFMVIGLVSVSSILSYCSSAPSVGGSGGVFTQESHRGIKANAYSSFCTRSPVVLSSFVVSMAPGRGVRPSISPLLCKEPR